MLSRIKAYRHSCFASDQAEANVRKKALAIGEKCPCAEQLDIMNAEKLSTSLRHSTEQEVELHKVKYV